VFCRGAFKYRTDKAFVCFAANSRDIAEIRSPGKDSEREHEARNDEGDPSHEAGVSPGSRPQSEGPASETTRCASKASAWKKRRRFHAARAEVDQRVCGERRDGRMQATGCLLLAQSGLRWGGSDERIRYSS
jgi:hypothetical protein